MTQKNWKTNNKNMNRELTNLLIGRKGGKTTIKIIDELLLKPNNINQLSKKLNLDYKTVLHHMNIIYEYKFVEKEKLKHATLYYPSDKLFNYLNEYSHIKDNIKKDN